jgi:hypothetical protein
MQWAMAKNFSFKIQGIDQLQRKLATVPVKLQKEVGGEIEDSARKINSKQLRLVPIDEGGIKQATGYRKTKPLEFELFSGKQYTPFMEFGTKSRKQIPAELQDYAKQFNFKGPKIGFDAFFQIILAWVHRKGIAGRFSTKTRKRVGAKSKQLEEDFDVAWPIALSILKKGVHPHPFFFQPFFEERKALVDRVSKIIDDIQL